VDGRTGKRAKGGNMVGRKPPFPQTKHEHTHAHIHSQVNQLLVVGEASRNRAVDGDFVAIEVPPRHHHATLNHKLPTVCAPLRTLPVCFGPLADAVCCCA
jgi:hypothetical protein